MSTGFTEQLTRDLAGRLVKAKLSDRLGPRPESIILSVADFCQSFGLSLEDIRSEVEAGRLILSGTGGITLGAYAAWRDNPSVPKALRAKESAYRKLNRVR